MHLTTKKSPAARKIGRFILAAAPYLMKFLTVAGTVAMFLVGGGLLVHKIDFLHEIVEHVSHLAAKATSRGSIAEKTTGMLLETSIGVIAGAVIEVALTLSRKFLGKNVITPSAN